MIVNIKKIVSQCCMAALIITHSINAKASNYYIDEKDTSAVRAIDTTNIRAIDTTNIEAIDTTNIGAIYYTNKVSYKIDKISSSRIYQMTCIGVPLIVAGLIVDSEDKDFRSLRNDYLPEFKHTYDNYSQYIPAAVMFGMKIAGVKGRSSWKRMLVSDAFSGIIMASVVNSLKYTSNVIRPDGSNNHSFPSGHTATAFMTATMLTKEYGHISPWIGIGAYASASATGLMRIANNKHWLSDVLTGAGIGVLSTELGYFIADMIFKDRGLYYTPQDIVLHSSNPSFLSLYMSNNIPISHYTIDDNTSFRTSSGATAGIEGAYFFNTYVGIGGRFTASGTSIIVNNETAEDNRFDAISLCGGGYFSYPISNRWNVGSKLLCGYMRYPKLKLSDMEITSRNCICFGSGLSTMYKATNHYGLRFFLDYNLQPSHNRRSNKWMNTLTYGAGFAILM